MKLCEKSGIQTIRFFNRIIMPDRCHDEGCPVCLVNNKKGPTRCRKTNVVYRAECLRCLEVKKDEESKRGRGIYIGETSRCLYERSREHIKLAKMVRWILSY